MAKSLALSDKKFTVYPQTLLARAVDYNPEVRSVAFAQRYFLLRRRMILCTFVLVDQIRSIWIEREVLCLRD